jgi:2-desacetyl-2-hydroxyethyl bacteriochlorophyllide A dehydrogenase
MRRMQTMGREVVITGPRQVDFRECETPKPARGEVLLKTLYSGISHGTEMNIYRGTAPFFRMSQRNGLFVEGEPAFKYPVPYGYEGVGEVVEVGNEVTKLKAGDIVAGAWAHRDEVVMSEGGPSVLPSGVNPVVGIFQALAGVALDSLLTSRARLGESAVVFGQGVVGVIVVQLCRLAGVEPIIAVDILNERLGRSKEAGADFTVNAASESPAEKVIEMTDGRGADVIIETSGSVKALHEGIRCGAPGYSRLVSTGWCQGGAGDLRLGEEFHHGGSHMGRAAVEILVNSHRLPPAPGRQWDGPRVVNKALDLIVRGKVKVEELISHRIPFADAPKAFELIDKHPADVLKVVLTF